MPEFFAARAWVGGRLERDVLIATEGDLIKEVTANAAPPAGCVRLPGLVLPGLVNAHSHAFQRALRTRTEEPGDFWSWRDAMYALAGRLDPDSMYRLALGAYCEMAAAGITTVGEFHYLHHGTGGVPYEDPNAMAGAVLAAARDAGLRITLLDACYLVAGLDGRPLDGVQQRFGDHSASAWADRVERLNADGRQLIGAAVHSVRAVPAEQIHVVAAWAGAHGAPLHAHVSEQPRENDECREATGLTPAGLLAREGAVGPRFIAVHATHAEVGDGRLLGREGAGICVCPTTERDLGDGVTPAAALAAAGCRLSLGSDSHAVVDLFEEARALELDERLAGGRRGLHAPASLLAAATAGGAGSLGWDAGRLEPGRCADLIAVDLESARTAGADPAAIVFAAAAADVTDVVVGGEHVVRDRVHARRPDWRRELGEEIESLWSS